MSHRIPGTGGVHALCTCFAVEMTCYHSATLSFASQPWCQQNRARHILPCAGFGDDLCTRNQCSPSRLLAQAHPATRPPFHPCPPHPRQRQHPISSLATIRSYGTCGGKGIFPTRKVTVRVCWQVQPFSEIQGSRAIKMHCQMSLRRDLLSSQQPSGMALVAASHTLLHRAAARTQQRQEPPPARGWSIRMVGELTPAVTSRQKISF